MNVKKYSRIALFIIYFWFGILKVFGSSPANQLVESLLKKTLPFITAPTFFILLGIFEMIIGVLFLLPRWTKVAKILFTLHMITTFMPLILLPAMTWQGFLTPTLEGQYIIKNLALIGLVLPL
ncbi:hypothetical protein KW783_01100 [Candidatus Parcubacteria bacterium]|nr:hypothetical protein [Candidatus Parcubacteria bacterium]